MSFAPAALLPAWWEPAYSAITIAGLACLGLAALIAARSRAADPWRRVARVPAARDRSRPRYAPRVALELRPPSPEPTAAAAAAHVARFATGRLPLVPTPGLSPAALQLVTGADRDAIVRGVVETAAQLRARGDSVLVVDAGRKLELHTAFGAESHWGVAECVHGRWPLLGVVQSTGRAGLFLLARGDAGADVAWRSFGALFDEATEHFARVIVAVEADCPPEAAPAFGPREIEGWWVGDGSRPRSAQSFTERVGIPLLGLAVRGSLPALLEGLSRSSRSRHREVPNVPAVLVEPERPTPPPPGTPSGLREIGEPLAPLVLAYDSRVAERLRFLTWARRIHRERSGAASTEAPSRDALAGAGVR